MGDGVDWQVRYEQLELSHLELQELQLSQAEMEEALREELEEVTANQKLLKKKLSKAEGALRQTTEKNNTASKGDKTRLVALTEQIEAQKSLIAEDKDARVEMEIKQSKIGRQLKAMEASLEDKDYQLEQALEEQEFLRQEMSDLEAFVEDLSEQMKRLQSELERAKNLQAETQLFNEMERKHFQQQIEESREKHEDHMNAAAQAEKDARDAQAMVAQVKLQVSNEFGLTLATTAQRHEEEINELRKTMQAEIDKLKKVADAKKKRQEEREKTDLEEHKKKQALVRAELAKVSASAQKQKEMDKLTALKNDKLQRLQELKQRTNQSSVRDRSTTDLRTTTRANNQAALEQRIRTLTEELTSAHDKNKQILAAQEERLHKLEQRSKEAREESGAYTKVLEDEYNEKAKEVEQAKRDASASAQTMQVLQHELAHAKMELQSKAEQVQVEMEATAAATAEIRKMEKIIHLRDDKLMDMHTRCLTLTEDAALGRSMRMQESEFRATFQTLQENIAEIQEYRGPESMAQGSAQAVAQAQQRSGEKIDTINEALAASMAETKKRKKLQKQLRALDTEWHKQQEHLDKVQKRPTAADLEKRKQARDAYRQKRALLIDQFKSGSDGMGKRRPRTFSIMASTQMDPQSPQTPRSRHVRTHTIGVHFSPVLTARPHGGVTTPSHSKSSSVSFNFSSPTGSAASSKRTSHSERAPPPPPASTMPPIALPPSSSSILTLTLPFSPSASSSSAATTTSAAPTSSPTSPSSSSTTAAAAAAASSPPASPSSSRAPNTPSKRSTYFAIDPGERLFQKRMADIRSSRAPPARARGATVGGGAIASPYAPRPLPSFGKMAISEQDPELAFEAKMKAARTGTFAKTCASPVLNLPPPPPGFDPTKSAFDLSPADVFSPKALGAMSMARSQTVSGGGTTRLGTVQSSVAVVQESLRPPNSVARARSTSPRPLRTPPPRPRSPSPR